MGQWLIADFSVSDVHFQLWMLLVATVILSLAPDGAVCLLAPQGRGRTAGPSPALPAFGN
jgi:hypothetical protein